MEKLIIAVAPTGSVPRKKDTPYVPVTPDEIAETAYLCEQEGASVIHVHCRDKNENPTSDYTIFKETVDKIRKRTNLIRKQAPPEAMYLGDLRGRVNLVPVFFKCDGKVDAWDLALFIQCYKGLGPDP